MHQPPATIGLTGKLQDAARLMRVQKIGCLAVVEGDHLVGILTEADLLCIVERLSDETIGAVCSAPFRKSLDREG